MVALSGDTIPGQVGDYTLSSVGTPLLNNLGDVAFLSYSYGNGPAIVQAKHGEELQTVVSSSSAVPSVEGNVQFNSFYGFNQNNSGQIAFSARLAGDQILSGINEDAIFSVGTLGETKLVARQQAYPNTPERVVSLGVYELAMNDAARLAFGADRQPPSSRQSPFDVIFTAESGEISVVIPSEDIGISSIIAPEVNNQGRVAFYGFQRSLDKESIFVFCPTDGLHAAVSRGTSIAIDEGVVQISSLGGFSQNNLGQIVFNAFLAGEAVDSTNDRAYFRIDEQRKPTLLARNGQLLPGMADQVAIEDLSVCMATGNLTNCDSRPILNSNGDVVLTARLAGPNISLGNEIAFLRSDASGNLSIAVQEGDHVLGEEAGTFFSFLASPGMNSNGQLVFMAALNGPDVGANNRIGLFAEDLDGNIQTIVREGDTLDVSRDPLQADERIVERISFYSQTGNEDGRQCAFNDLGQVVFAVDFTDGSNAVLVSNLVAVPEPGSLLLAGGLLIYLYMVRCHSTA